MLRFDFLQVEGELGGGPAPLVLTYPYILFLHRASDWCHNLWPTAHTSVHSCASHRWGKLGGAVISFKMRGNPWGALRVTSSQLYGVGIALEWEPSPVTPTLSTFPRPELQPRRIRSVGSLCLALLGVSKLPSKAPFQLPSSSCSASFPICKHRSTSTNKFVEIPQPAKPLPRAPGWGSSLSLSFFFHLCLKLPLIRLGIRSSNLVSPSKYNPAETQFPYLQNEEFGSDDNPCFFPPSLSFFFWKLEPCIDIFCWWITSPWLCLLIPQASSKLFQKRDFNLRNITKASSEVVLTVLV